VGRMIERGDIVDYQTYDDGRDATRERIFEVKRPRRIHLGEHLTFLFENRDTLTYQIQEIMRAERIVRESAIRDEIDVYNAMLGDPGDLACALLIEIEDAERRPVLLREWLGLEQALYVRLDDDTLVRAVYDPAQVGDDRISAVQYLRFPVAGRTPVAIGTDFAALTDEAPLTDEQRAALAADLAA